MAPLPSKVDFLQLRTQIRRQTLHIASHFVWEFGVCRRRLNWFVGWVVLPVGFSREDRVEKIMNQVSDVFNMRVVEMGVRLTSVKIDTFTNRKEKILVDIVRNLWSERRAASKSPSGGATFLRERESSRCAQGASSSFVLTGQPFD